MREQEFIFPLRIYTEDTDCGGVVYHANYLRFFERARSEWAEKLRFGLEWMQNEKINFVVRSVQMDYLKPARLHQQVEVVTRISAMGRVSLSYDQHLRLAGTNGTILCKALINVVCVNHQFRPQGLPPALKNLLDELIVEN